MDEAEVPVYLRIAEKAKHLRELGMSDKAIARALSVCDKTVAKAARGRRWTTTSQSKTSSTAAGARRDTGRVPHLRACG